MTYILIWLALSALAFLALRHLALRDFGVVTIGGLIALITFSLLTPCALLLALALSLEGKKTVFSKAVWTRR